MRITITARIVLLAALLPFTQPIANAQQQPSPLLRGSLIEDRAARKLIEAGDTRYEAGEKDKAVEIWQSVLERYPRNKHRFTAHMRLGNLNLQDKGAYEKARGHFENVAAEDNEDQEMRAEATLKLGRCFYEGRHYAQCYKTFRVVIEQFPTSKHVNSAYYYIGLAHFNQKHYSRAIEALEKVGTALTNSEESLEKVEAGKRLFVKIDDADLAILEHGQKVPAKISTTLGDEEHIDCIPVGNNVKLAIGSILTDLGKPIPGNGIVELVGNDKVTVTYTDAHTSDMEFNKPRTKEITVVGNAVVEITDGSFNDTLRGAVLGKVVNVQIKDADMDRTDNADTIQALMGVYRRKNAAEIEEEIAAVVAKGEIDIPPGTDPAVFLMQGEAPVIKRFRQVDSVNIILTEVPIQKENRRQAAQGEAQPTPENGESGDQGDPGQEAPTPQTQPEKQSEAPSSPPANEAANTLHTGVFRATISLEKAEEGNPEDFVLQGLPSDIIRVSYNDDVNMGVAPAVLEAEAQCIEGNLGGVRVTQTEIEDPELRLQTQLKTANALTNIGNHYKEFGLQDKANLKYEEALMIAEETAREANKLGGTILENTYVQLWEIYQALGNMNLAAAMSARLMREFPNSGFIDDAILSQAEIAQEKGDLAQAIVLYNNLLRLQESPLRSEGAYGVAVCYEKMAENAPERSSIAMYERAFEAYQRVFDQFPESGRVGDAVAKMANFYYKKKDYQRAIDVFENVLQDHPDANFLDVILFNYGRCLYRVDQKGQARRQFDRLIGDFPESKLAGEAKRISDALAKAGF
jgi:tetratricopeptide (TPR) repeat protein